MKKAFITGVTGQDGSYLADVLLEWFDECWKPAFARYLIHDPVHHVNDVRKGYARLSG